MRYRVLDYDLILEHLGSKNLPFFEKRQVFI